MAGDALVRFYHDLGDGLSHQPGVKNVSFAGIVPLTHFVWDEIFSVTGGKSQETWMNSVSPGYFSAMRIPMLEGRDFTWNDTTPAGLKIILNRAEAKLLFPGQNAVGQHVIKQDMKTPVSYEVIGVVGDAKYEDLRSPAPPGAYVPMTQDDQHQWHSYTAVVRMDGPAAPLSRAARALAARMAPDIPPPVMTSMSSVVDDSLSAERMMALLSVFFAACALLVTAIGLYGTLAYATARRTGEIGIRMALGAGRAQVMGMVFRQNAAVAIAARQPG